MGTPYSWLRITINLYSQKWFVYWVFTSYKCGEKGYFAIAMGSETTFNLLTCWNRTKALVLYYRLIVSSELPKAAKGLASKPRTKQLIVFHIPNTHNVNRVPLARETWRCN